MGGALAAIERAVHCAVMTVEFGGLAGKEKRPLERSRQLTKSPLATRHRVAVAAAAEGIALPIVNKVLDELGAQCLRRNPEQARQGSDGAVENKFRATVAEPAGARARRPARQNGSRIMPLRPPGGEPFL